VKNKSIFLLILPFELILFVHVSIVDFVKISIKVQQVEDDFEVLLFSLKPKKKTKRISYSFEKKFNFYLLLNNHLILFVV
jgi:hypothetical protein